MAWGMARRLGVLLVGLGAVLVGPAPARAADACFCLRHTQTDALLRGCTAFKGATDFYETADCVDPETGVSSEQLIAFGWERVAAGEVGCAPCRPPPRVTSERPRGEDGEEDEAGGTQEPAEGAEGRE